eukprot:827876-Rhodomonas_salina.1
MYEHPRLCQCWPNTDTTTFFILLNSQRHSHCENNSKPAYVSPQSGYSNAITSKLSKPLSEIASSNGQFPTLLQGQ